MPLPSQKKLQREATVLFVDSPVDRVAEKTIQGMGHRFLPAEQREKAINILKDDNQEVDIFVSRIRDKGEDFSLFDLAKQFRPGMPQIAIIHDTLEEYFPELLIRAYPQNLVADNQPLDYRELASTIQKLLTNEIFGLDKYGLPIDGSCEIERSQQKYQLIEKVRTFFLDKGVQDRINRNVELILNELLMNAIFDAPIDKEGNRKYFQVKRSAKFDLEPSERPILQWGINHDRLGVSVSDPFGTFKEDTFFSYVHRCFAEKSVMEERGKGAGMGLFMVFKSLNQLVINVEFNKRTEVIALINYHSSLRDLKKARHSFNFFHLGEP